MRSGSNFINKLLNVERAVEGTSVNCVDSELI